MNKNLYESKGVYFSHYKDSMRERQRDRKLRLLESLIYNFIMECVPHIWFWKAVVRQPIFLLNFHGSHGQITSTLTNQILS